jgi:uncharacterized protein (DUF488 family)
MSGLYTIGHSTRSIEEFLALLRSHGIAQLADVRSIPRSARHPQFAAAALSTSLQEVGIVYRHCPGLGGLRRPRKDSPNMAWRHPSFRGYADYMQTAAFKEALEELLVFAEAGRTAVMCAEALWWRCHRRLLADALVSRGIEVRHITSAQATSVHELSPSARIAGGRVTYPGRIG